MRTSPSIAALGEALAKAQGQIKPALKDSANPFYKSKYADLASVWNACREALSQNGLAVVQGVSSDLVEKTVTVTTRLIHAGEFVEEELCLPAIQAGKAGAGERFDAQCIGSVITYARRYALAAMVGVAPDDDDDGQSQAGPRQQQRRQDGVSAQAAAAARTKPQVQQQLEAAIPHGYAHTSSVWQQLEPAERKLFTQAEIKDMVDRAKTHDEPAQQEIEEPASA